MTQKTIAVFGATGSQGGSVVRYLKAQGVFRVRAMTRQPDAYRGPADEAAYADLDGGNALHDALKDAYGVFLVTNFWQPGTNEIEQATAAVRAAKETGVSHFVWSSLPNVEAISSGKWDVPHFSDKSHVEAIVRNADFPIYTVVQPPFYFENLVGNMAPQSMSDGRTGWTLPIDPDARVIHMGSIGELGSLVAGVFAHPEISSGETLSMSAGLYGFSDVCSAYGAATGQEIGFQRVTHEAFEGFFPQAREISQMLGYFEDHTYMGPGSDGRIAKAQEIATGPFTPLDSWLAAKLAPGR